jgi:hypothetical protein
MIEWEAYITDLGEDSVTLEFQNEQKHDPGLSINRKMRDRLNWRLKPSKKLQRDEKVNTTLEILVQSNTIRRTVITVSSEEGYIKYPC